MGRWAFLSMMGLVSIALVLGCKSKSNTAGSVSGGGAGVATTQPAGGGGAARATCQRQPVANPSALTIAVIPMGSTHEYWKAIHAGAVKAELELKGVQIQWKGPVKEDDRTSQVNVVENFVNAGVSGIALAPLDNKALVQPVREAAKAGIGVVVLDSGLDAELCTDYASFVATDNYVGGQKGARRLGTILGGKGKVILLRCEVGFASTMQREKGFLETLAAEFPEIQLVSSDQHGGATAAEAQNKAESLLQRFTDVDGIFTPNESTTFGMLRALQVTGRAGKTKFVGFDSSAKLVEALGKNEIHGLVLQDPVNIGYLGVKTLAAYLRGEAVPSRVDTGCEVATPENMSQPRMQELLSPPVERYLSK
jgi:ribose transport system substrate-binding protein